MLRDQLTTPKGESLVRVIQASLRDHKVTVTAGSQVLARQLAFGNVTNYGTARPGTWMVHVSGAAGMATQSVTLASGTIHTLVVLDGGSGGLVMTTWRTPRAARCRRREAPRRAWAAPHRSLPPHPHRGPPRSRPGPCAAPQPRSGCAGSGTWPVTRGRRMGRGRRGSHTRRYAPTGRESRHAGQGGPSAG